MKKKYCTVIAGLLASVIMAGCGADPELTQFRNDLDMFCKNVAELDASINQIDADADNAPELALGYLDKLDKEFQDFAELDFPEEYDYLESLADEASSYMSESAKSYHSMYETDSYDEDTAAYARETSARAFKRVQVIIDVLQGEYDAADAQQNEIKD